MNTLLMGAVAYDPKVVTIWSGFRAWLTAQGFPFDFLLYSQYERLAEDVVSGTVDAAWCSPLAWIRARRLAAAAGTTVRALVMRDTDRDLTSVVVVRANSRHTALGELKGECVAVGALDSPQATLLPLTHLDAAGLTPHQDCQVLRHDIGVGLHGDHIGGERAAARALARGDAAAACMTDSNHLLFTQEGTLPPGGTRVLSQTGAYDHCVMAVSARAAEDSTGRFADLLMSMSYADPVVRRLLDLEGLNAWLPGRESGYGALNRAVDALAFYDAHGAITAEGYLP